MTSSGFGIGGAVIGRKDITTNIANDHPLSRRLRRVRQVPAQPRQRPDLLPVHAIMALNDMRTLRSKMDLVSRNTRRWPSASQKHPKVEQVEYLGLPNTRCTSWPASTCGWSTPRRRDGQAGQPLRPPDVLLRQRRRRRTPARSSTASSGSGGPPTSAGSRAWPRSRPSRPTSSRARRPGAGRHPAEPDPAVRRRASTPTTSSPTSTRP